MKILNITRAATAATIAGALVVAAIAYASTNKSQPTLAATHVTNPATLPKFTHVQVVNATAEQIAALSKSAPQLAQSQRAYVDAQSRQLRPAFPEEIAAESAAALPPQSAAAPVTMADGTSKMQLDESHMSYAVARIDADGSVKQDCVTDKADDKAALTSFVAESGVDRHEK
jgi:hypothetical protein